MTVTIFLGALLGPMALGVPIAFALIISGVALMMYLGMFDAQIVAQNVLNGADSFPLMAVPFFLLAGEVMNTGRPVAAYRRSRHGDGRPCARRPRLRGHLRGLRSFEPLRFGRSRCCSTRRAALPDDAEVRP